MKTVMYVDANGYGYDVNKGSDGTWSVWQWVNKETGWCWKGTPSYSLAMSSWVWFLQSKK
jgi:hypothetical protein